MEDFQVQGGRSWEVFLKGKPCAREHYMSRDYIRIDKV